MIETGLQLGLGVLVILLLPMAYRVLKGPTAAERLQALDVITMLLIGIIMLLAGLQQIGLFVDVALALAAFGFIATMGIARYLAEGKVF